MKKSPLTKYLRRIELMRLRNQGLSFKEIAFRFSLEDKRIINQSSVWKMYQRIKDKTIEELEEDYQKSIGA